MGRFIIAENTTRLNFALGHDSFSKFKHMKKIIITAVIALFSMTTFAQANWELGLRFANGDFDAVAVDATVPLGAPRLHMTGYFAHDLFATGFYFDWLFTLPETGKSLKFYPGVGPELYFGHDLEFGIAGNLGMEYSFDFPLTIGLDWRPAIQFFADTKVNANNLGLTARFNLGRANFQRAR